MTRKLAPIHPGEVLLEEFLKPMSLSQNRKAIDIGVDGCRINAIVLGKRAITALPLSRFFDNSPQFWMRLQTQYDLDVAEDQLGMGKRMRAVVSTQGYDNFPNGFGVRIYMNLKT